jgi:hypothetical protein
MRLREGLRSNRRCDVSVLARIMEDYAFLCIYASRRNALNSADEHAQTSVSEHGHRHLPRPAGAQTAQKQHAGLLELDAQPSAARIRLPEGAERKVPASVRRACIPDTYAASGPEPGTEGGS